MIQTADPANHRALVADAQINMVLQNYGPAASALSQALELAPEIADQVVAFYRQMLAKNPDQPQVKMALAKSLVVKDSLDEAVALIEQSLSQDAALAEPAVGLLRQVLQRDKENVAGLYLLSRIYAQRNAAEQSVEMLRQILELTEGPVGRSVVPAPGHDQTSFPRRLRPATFWPSSSAGPAAMTWPWRNTKPSSNCSPRTGPGCWDHWPRFWSKTPTRPR